MGVTKELAAYVVSAELDAIPQDVRHEAHRALLNYVGCAVGGSRELAVDIAIRALAQYSGKPIARVLGRSDRLDPLHAAR
jgi:2-methylcitrate dehydratase PrpD